MGSFKKLTSRLPYKPNIDSLVWGDKVAASSFFSGDPKHSELYVIYREMYQLYFMSTCHQKIFVFIVLKVSFKFNFV